MSVGLISFVSQNVEWEIPEEYKTMENPEEVDLEYGEDVWSQNCKFCHGKDGSKFLDISEDTDGELFYKTLKGKGRMPGYSKRLDEEEIWQVVHYMKSIKK